MDEINKDQMDFMWDIIHDDMYPSLEDEMIPKQILNNAIKDAKAHSGKIKFVRPKKDTEIKSGDRVMNKDGIYGTVIDIDDDRVCIELINKDMEICKISEIKKIMS